MRMQRAERGMILVVVMVAVVVVAALAMGYLLSARSQSTRAEFSEENVKIMSIAEAGVAAALADLRAGNAGNLDEVSFGGDGGSYTTLTTINGNYYTINATATFGPWSRTIEVVAERGSATLQGPMPRAAIESLADIGFLGNFEVDGRDYDFNGNLIAGAAGDGVFGVSSAGTTTQGGSSTIGGNGIAPEGSLAAAESGYNWADGNDNDGDGTVDDEAWDGIDNDGDGAADEDTIGFPNSPDAVLGLTEGTLKGWAQADGTYFASQAAVEAYIAANGGILPGGKIYYCEFEEWQVPDFNSEGSSSDPSILVMHTAGATSSMKNFHGVFRGLMMIDQMDHINSGAEVLGNIKCFGAATIGNTFGNGVANAHFSSAVLANLPADPNSLNTFEKISWREIVE